MTTSATDSSNSGLHHVTRTVQSDAYSGNLEIYKHGFLRVSANGRYLTYADGTPFFYLGDTHWILSHERFDTSNAPGVSSQFKYIVDKRVSQGFTVFQSEPGWQERSALIRTDEEASADFKDGFTSADLAGFANLDRKFKYIADHGLVHANAEICWWRPCTFSDSYRSVHGAACEILGCSLWSLSSYLDHRPGNR